MNFDTEIQLLKKQVQALIQTSCPREKSAILESHPRVQEAQNKRELDPFFPYLQSEAGRLALFSLVVIDQHLLLLGSRDRFFKLEHRDQKMNTLIAKLSSIDQFYASIGGIVGYHLKVLESLHSKDTSLALSGGEAMEIPLGLNLELSCDDREKAFWEGIQALPLCAEIYPIGGLGSRLNLINEHDEPLPVATLPFCGRSLLEGLLRDVAAREFLYYRLYRQQVTLPIAMMTSLEKRNHHHIEALCEQKQWFNRPKESFFLFQQLSVPVLTHEGKWSSSEPLDLNLQPGGHGALWKAADESGVFKWIKDLGRRYLLVRQINNPIAGLDFGLIAFMGEGKRRGKVFGFLSCERLPEAAEGVLVVVKEEGKAYISNIEYTEFQKLKGRDLSAYPANTNILFLDVDQMESILQKKPLPGLILNMKSQVPVCSPEGTLSHALGGRLESMMQNISEAIAVPAGEPLTTFVTRNSRSKTISAAKKSYEPGGSFLETPEGVFYDLQLNAYALLKNHCNATLPPLNSQREFLEKGPSFLFLYHPALGPLYSLIGQKIQHLTLEDKSELQLEIADLKIENLKLEGSLLIEAKQVLGSLKDGRTCYDQNTGKCHLKNVTVKNLGIDRQSENSYWQSKIARKEALEIVLEGRSEFYAENVTFSGKQRWTVPDGERWIVSQQANGELKIKVEQPSWEWELINVDGQILLKEKVHQKGCPNRPEHHAPSDDHDSFQVREWIEKNVMSKAGDCL